jgi:ligand-binding SRPBCC domain-containing protein
VTVIRVETLMAASPARCFDVARSVDVHLRSASKSRERVIPGPTAGLLGPGDEITWEARHLGVRRRLTVRITAYDRPRSFRDEQVRGPFRKLRHDHRFEPHEEGTLMRDELEFRTAFPPLDALIIGPHLRRFLVRRNETIRRIAGAAGASKS